MISTLLPLTNTKDTGPLGPILKPLKECFDTHLARSLNSSISTARSSSVAHRSSLTIGTSVNDLPSLLSHSHCIMHVGRMAVGRHDIDAWAEERKAHDTELDAVEASFSLASNGIAGEYFPVDVARSSFAPMELQSESRFIQRLPNTGWLPADTAVRPHEWTSPVAPGFGLSAVQPDVSIGYLSREGLSEGRRRVGQIIVRCGVINVSGMPPIAPTIVGREYDSVARPANTPAIPSVIAELHSGENEGLLTTALANWTSDWTRTLVIQPYLQGNFRFQYLGQPSRASTSVALRIRRILNAVENSVQVAIHTLWLIGTLTGNGAHDNAPFLSVPIFRYLHNNGAFVAEDFMFHTFVICAMIGDKTVNDATLTTNTWSRLTGIPQVILNATEKYALSCLKWNILMTRTQWLDTIIYLRSCIKMGSAFDPFAHDATSPSGIMACYLNELIDMSYGDKIYMSHWKGLASGPLAPQPDQDLTHWGVFDIAGWCPKDDPVINQKPRTICIAPGADQKSTTPKVGTTAKDLLDSILGSSNILDLAHLAQPAGTSFCGSFGIIGARLADTIRIARHGACQSASWVPSHG